LRRPRSTPPASPDDREERPGGADFDRTGGVSAAGLAAGTRSTAGPTTFSVRAYCAVSSRRAWWLMWLYAMKHAHEQ